MPLDGYGEQPASSGKCWFVIIAASDTNRVLERFEAVDWAPAVLEYSARLQRGVYTEPVSLRKEQPGEIVR